MNRLKKTMAKLIVLSLLLSPTSLVWAEDSPASYLGPGYRDYLNGVKKIRQGFSLKEFTVSENRKKEEIHKLNQIKGIVSHSAQAGLSSSNEISKLNFQKLENARMLTWTIKQSLKRIEKNATAETEFKYVKHTNGKFVYSTDGLPTTIDKEPIIDEFGNLSLRTTRNMFYNNKRLLTSYQTDLTDNLGNTIHIFCYGISYSPDSIFYADDETTANKNEMEKYIREEDSAGNVTLIHWEALSYDGKLLRAFHQNIEDSIYGTYSFTRSNVTYNNNNYRQISSYYEQGVGADGLAYGLERNNVTYNGKDLVTGYHEEKDTTQLDGTNIKTISDAQFTYLAASDEFGPDIEEPVPDRLLESVITVTIINLDGSQKTETVTTAYNYDAAQQLTGASGNSALTGQDASWWQYTNTQGHTLIRAANERGNTIYFYTNTEGRKIEVPEEEVIAALKDGNTYSGSSDIRYEILFGKPAYSQVDTAISYYNPQSLDLLRTETSTTTYTNGLKNNLSRVLNTLEHTEVIYISTVDLKSNHQKHVKDILTTYSYAENGNLTGARGSGSGLGYELTDQGWMKYDSVIEIDYEEYLGEVKETEFEEMKNYRVKVN